MITQEHVKELFEYKDGHLFWKISAGSYKPGSRAGTCRTDGYRVVKIKSKVFLEHRLIYLLLKGSLPNMLDHIDNDRSNNLIENLRPCTEAENARNSHVNVNNTSGVKGVTWDTQHGKWRAQLCIDGKSVFLGKFTDIKEAEIVVRAAREELHGEFARHV